MLWRSQSAPATQSGARKLGPPRTPTMHAFLHFRNVCAILSFRFMTLYRLIREGCAGCRIEITDPDGRIGVYGGFQTEAEASAWISERLKSRAASLAEHARRRSTAKGSTPKPRSGLGSS